jgi:hypothetical protein
MIVTERPPDHPTPGAPPEPPPGDGLARFLENVRALPGAIRHTALRTGGLPTTDRTRSNFVFGNVFLHLHAVRTHRWSLRWSTTMGLGIARSGRS